jgi:hypothetical protein
MTDTVTDTLNHPTANASPSVASRIPLMIGALAALIVANAAQIAAGLAAIDPSPPAEVLPLLAATVAVGVAAVPMVRAGSRHGLLLGIAFCALSLIGMGPHKLFFDNGLVLAPLALSGFAFEIAFVGAALRELRQR